MSRHEVDADPEHAVRAIVAEARHAVEADHAEVICLGCAGMAGLEETITTELGVPVIDGIGAAVRPGRARAGRSRDRPGIAVAGQQRGRGER